MTEKASRIDRAKSIISESLSVKQAMLADEQLVATLADVIGLITECFLSDGKLLLCGNGGSAADAQHIAAELSGRFYLDRKGLFAEALHVNTSYLTAVANDYGFEGTYARLVGAKGRPGDVLIAISTSGNSPNILEAAKAAKAEGMIVVGMTGESGGKLKGMVDYLLAVPSGDTPRVQEGHILLGHVICEEVEGAVFGG